MRVSRTHIQGQYPAATEEDVEPVLRGDSIKMRRRNHSPVEKWTFFNEQPVPRFRIVRVLTAAIPTPPAVGGFRCAQELRYKVRRLRHKPHLPMHSRHS